MVAALDLWTLLVVYAFGNFWVAVIGIAILMFIIMGPLGRMSVYSCIWYFALFMAAMALGYGYVLVTMLVTLALLVSFYFATMRYTSS